MIGITTVALPNFKYDAITSVSSKVQNLQNLVGQTCSYYFRLQKANFMHYLRFEQTLYRFEKCSSGTEFISVSRNQLFFGTDNTTLS